MLPFIMLLNVGIAVLFKLWVRRPYGVQRNVKHFYSYNCHSIGFAVIKKFVSKNKFIQKRKTERYNCEMRI